MFYLSFSVPGSEQDKEFPMLASFHMRPCIGQLAVPKSFLHAFEFQYAVYCGISK